MLGGSVWISFLRNGLGAGLMMTVFMLLEHPAASWRKMVTSCILFWLLATTGFSFWYIVDDDSFIRFAGLLSIPVVGIFCIWIGRDRLYLSLYKLTLAFYLLTVTVFLGIDLSRLWFGGSICADIMIRVVLMAVIVFLLVTKIRKKFLDGVDYLREEMDWFSAVTLLLSVLTASMVAFWPGSHDFSMLHIGRVAILLFMTGLIQYMVFHLYLHRGKERRYRTEHELIEMNGQLIRHQLELMNQSKEEGSEEKRGKRFCENETMDRLLSAYKSLAEKERIQVDMYVRTATNFAMREIDLAAVLVCTFENAIRGCIESNSSKPQIYLSVIQKGKKIVILCRNTCASNIKMKDGMPEHGIGEWAGSSGVMKVLSFYHGEADFSVENGMFTVRILLNLLNAQQVIS